MLADHDAKVHKTLLITKHYINYFYVLLVLTYLSIK